MKTFLQKSKICSFIAFVCFFLCSPFLSIGQTWDEIIKLTASDAAAGDIFGSAVALSGNTAIVGAEGNDDYGSSSGSAYIFHLEGDTWIETQKLTASDAAASDLFGLDVSISGERLIVGASGNDDDDDGLDIGSAYIFDLEGDTWIETQKLTASDAAASDQIGLSVSISGNRVLLGAHGNDDDGSGSGSAYIFSTCATLPAVAIDYEGSDICEGDTLTLTATGADTYFWEGDVEDGDPDRRQFKLFGRFFSDIGNHGKIV